MWVEWNVAGSLQLSRNQAQQAGKQQFSMASASVPVSRFPPGVPPVMERDLKTTMKQTLSSPGFWSWCSITAVDTLTPTYDTSLVLRRRSKARIYFRVLVPSSSHPALTNAPSVRLRLYFYWIMAAPLPSHHGTHHSFSGLLPHHLWLRIFLVASSLAGEEIPHCGLGLPYPVH